VCSSDLKKLLVPLLFIPTLLFSQSRKERKAMQAQQKADQQVISNFKSHVQNLTGGKTAIQQAPYGGVANAANYVANQFKSEGLQPKGTNGYFQPFTSFDGKKIDPSTYLKVHDNLLEINKEYFPLPYSAEKKVTGRPAMALRERGVPWFADLKDWLEDGGNTPGNLQEAIKKEVVKVAGKGASALFLYNSGKTQDGIKYDKKDTSAPLSIPVVFITPQGYAKYFSDNSQTLDIDLSVHFKESNITGNNVIGYLDNSAPATIVIAAHYNLPSEETNSGQEKGAETGPDDNGSGTAMLIELARMLSASKAKHNNYLFIALGGSDLGASAARHWLANATVASPVNYMLNLDMVGSYDESKKLAVKGYTSSPVWDLVFASIPDKKIAVRIDSTNADGLLASFYEKGIPVLSFSTGAHTDYSNKTDEEGRINYEGELQIAKFINKLVEATDSRGKVAFDRSSLYTIAWVEKSVSF